MILKIVRTEPAIILIAVNHGVTPPIVGKGQLSLHALELDTMIARIGFGVVVFPAPNGIGYAVWECRTSVLGRTRLVDAKRADFRQQVIKIFAV